jgi:DNA repair and recombination protein RAD54 and RAD54-like protein
MTAGEGIAGRPRSMRKCLDKKLLEWRMFSNPIKIDISDSSSESEEEIPPPTAMHQGLLSSSEDYGAEARRKRRNKNKKREKKPDNTSDDEYQVKARRYRRQKMVQGASREGGQAYDCLKHSGPNEEQDISNAQDDRTFKEHANFAKMRKNLASRAKATYDELFNSLSAEWEKPTDATH